MYKIIANIKNLPKTEFLMEQDKNHVPKEKLQTDESFLPLRFSSQQKALDKIGNTPDAELVNMAGFDRFAIDDSITERLGELLGLKKPQARCQVLKPGEMAMMHIDDLDGGYMRPVEGTLAQIQFTKEELDTFDANPHCATRFLIMLEDSKPGQGIIFGTQGLTEWKAGDVIHWDWVNTYHSTFNTSFWNRGLIRLTGLQTDKTHAIINGNKLSLEM